MATGKRIARLLGGFDVTIYPTALGEFWRTSNIHGPVIKLLGPQSEPCVHYLTAGQARDIASALTELADEIEALAAGGPQQG